ncbi:MAG: replication/maintenance protein RepL [Terricaulis sp.]
MADQVPPFTRPGAFAATELMLDLFYLTTDYFQLDLEAIWILAVVGHETMRPWILDPTTASSHLTDQRVPDEVRGSISRAMVADRTGLPRETVRRRIAELEKSGLIVLDQRGYVRLHGKNVLDPAYQKSVVDIYRAAERYQERIAAFGVEPGE